MRWHGLRRRRRLANAGTVVCCPPPTSFGVSIETERGRQQNGRIGMS